MSPPNLDRWLPAPTLRVAHSRTSTADADALWRAAQDVKLKDTGLLGRLIRWRIPGTPPELTFDELFRGEPFRVLDETGAALVSGLVGRIWTLRRDYPRLSGPDEFRGWSTPGSAKVLFANWAEDGALHSEVRVQVFGAQGRVGLAAVRPLIAGFQHLVASEGIEAAVRRAEKG